MATESQPEPLGIGIIARYLVGNREAIIAVASSRSALWVGLLFVLSADFAREYDGEDLLHEPWHVLIPLAASTVTSLILFVLTFTKLAWRSSDRPTFLAAYRSFLGLYWMTAPLAWLYAIPYERFLSAPDSIRANLYTLAFVAMWRVVLMIRVVSVVMGYGIVSAAINVISFGVAVAFVVAAIVPSPVVSLMGGIRLTESEALIHNVTFIIGVLSVLASPLLILAWFCSLFAAKPVWNPCIALRPSKTSWPLRALAFLSIAGWVVVLPRTQPEQTLRWRAEQQLRNGQIAAALDLMSEHDRGDFPPHWDPPPRPGYHENTPDIYDVIEQIADGHPDNWVRALYLKKFEQHLSRAFDRFNSEAIPLGRTLDLLSRLPEGRRLAQAYQDDMRFLEEGDRARLQELLQEPAADGK